MSKAFTRESDDLPERPIARPISLLPPGARNYMTEEGARRARAELDRLLNSTVDGVVERGSPERTNPRIQLLQRALQTAEIVPPPPPPHDQVRFGATVVVRDAQGLEEEFRIVGVDEADPERDWISWRSPLARALLNARLGELVRLQLPGGIRELAIVGIRYQAESS